MDLNIRMRSSQMRALERFIYTAHRMCNAGSDDRHNKDRNITDPNKGAGHCTPEDDCKKRLQNPAKQKKGKDDQALDLLLFLGNKLDDNKRDHHGDRCER